MNHYTDQRRERAGEQHFIVCELYLGAKSPELHSKDETERNPFYYFYSNCDQNNLEIKRTTNTHCISLTIIPYNRKLSHS